jgi:hypothetical protein
METERLKKNQGGRGRRPAPEGAHPRTSRPYSAPPPALPDSYGGLAEPGARVESTAASEFTRVMRSAITPAWESAPGKRPSTPAAPRLNLDQDKVKNGLGQLVLTLVKLLHELLERQAIRRIDAGYLSDEESERLGLAMMTQAQEIDRLRRLFGLKEEDLNLDLGPLGKLL